MPATPAYNTLGQVTPGTENPPTLLCGSKLLIVAFKILQQNSSLPLVEDKNRVAT
ncbi:hypothetical protein PCANC_01259 [Puccinia coronata f. sp. avenae]|uniref:Uncharacterized protein n=1 Tax=Puccinia coronata f. sp. avenae TaxID=200324 RepID=A0A2N5W3R3_9BASI|nr:hypothetical protein PCANC_05066 [Puccinia coronata f. sp. avenae]PLW44275.1 hypothetical protein PCASD_03819 [Puccinia coronata f. sp. avenae]PLW56877.1 hypothetical protein PCANC_01259 [Puccinia coronata f. sp. avenae]